MSGHKKVMIALAILIVLTPLGLITENPAWGEWDGEQMAKIVGFVPQGVKEGSFFKAPLADYSFAPLGEIGGYIFNAALGSIIVISIFYTLKKLFGVQK